MSRELGKFMEADVGKIQPRKSMQDKNRTPQRNTFTGLA